jgi:hypothetical protein
VAQEVADQRYGRREGAKKSWCFAVRPRDDVARLLFQRENRADESQLSQITQRHLRGEDFSIVNQSSLSAG